MEIIELALGNGNCKGRNGSHRGGVVTLAGRRGHWLDLLLWETETRGADGYCVIIVEFPAHACYAAGSCPPDYLRAPSARITLGRFLESALRPTASVYLAPFSTVSCC